MRGGGGGGGGGGGDNDDDDEIKGTCVLHMCICVYYFAYWLRAAS